LIIKIPGVIDRSKVGKDGIKIVGEKPWIVKIQEEKENKRK
jgi:hypothetical protein